jgi:hypothetical protein
MQQGRPSNRTANRLASETSPYLLQHAHNPVAWYAWCAEAFERAKAEDKPIFLSVGYSTCYWCHVMERQCFEVDAIAAVMNEHVVSIKVDREERPDVDQLYMTATQMLSHQGGWPMSVWMTPDGRPFYAGTYFPPEDAYNRPGFPRLIEAIGDAWKNRRAEIEQQADSVAKALKQYAAERAERGPIPKDEQIDKLVLRACEDYEPRHGGFGRAPKFPRQTLLRLLLTWIESKPEGDADRARVEPMLRHTLTAMANGGIRDHLGGAFHRYSTDAKWLVPHFEIMLYDQAMLAPIYARAARVLNEPRFASVARGICDAVLRDLCDPNNGAFFTALDAEVNAREGLNYLWTPEQVAEVLGEEDAKTFNAIYGLDEGFNFADPHHGSGVPDANVLFLSADHVAREDDPAIATLRGRLLISRMKREQPMLDTKIITSWNGLMIEALATCSVELAEPRYRDAAAKAADYLLTRHRRGDGSLVRTTRDGLPAPHEAYLDDSASLAVALQELSVATGDRRWKQEADNVLDQLQRRFGDADRGGFFFTSSASHELIVRQKTATDSPLPAGNALAAVALLRAGRVDAARQTIEAFASLLHEQAGSTSALLEAALLVNQQGDAYASGAADIVGLGAAALDGPSPHSVVSCSGERIGTRRIRVIVRIKPGFHLYDTNLDEKLGLTPTRVRVALECADAVESIEYPPSKLLELAYGPPVRGYDGEIEISVRFREDLPDEKVELSVSYQACDDSACLMPAVTRCEA